MAQRKGNRKRTKQAKDISRLRVHRLNIRFGPGEIDTLQQAANFKHISISSFVRSTVLEAAEGIMRHSCEGNGVAV